MTRRADPPVLSPRAKPESCPTHGALMGRNCAKCNVFFASIHAYGYPEAPGFEDWASGVADCLARIEAGQTPFQIRLWLAEERAALRQTGVAA